MCLYVTKYVQSKKLLKKTASKFNRLKSILSAYSGMLPKRLLMWLHFEKDVILENAMLKLHLTE